MEAPIAKKQQIEKWYMTKPKIKSVWRNKISHGRKPEVNISLACVTSVSVGFPRKFRCFGRAKMQDSDLSQIFKLMASIQEGYDHRSYGLY